MLQFEHLLSALCFTAHSLPCSITFCPSWSLYCALLDEARTAGATALHLPPDLMPIAERSHDAQIAPEHTIERLLKELQDVSNA